MFECDGCQGTGRERHGSTTRACYYCEGKGRVNAEPQTAEGEKAITPQTRYVALYHAHGGGAWCCSSAFRQGKDAVAFVGELYLAQSCDAATVVQIEVEA